MADELAVVNTAANDFPKGALFCKGRLISKPQIPFAGVIENILQEVVVQNTTITNTNLYFLQDKIVLVLEMVLMLQLILIN